MGIGIEPAVDMVEGSGIDVDNGVVVDEYCETNVSGVYAAGDVANHYHPSSIAGSEWNTGRTPSSRRRCRAQHARQACRVRGGPLVLV